MIKRASRTNAGFTLVELMIVIAIIGVLSAVAVPNFQRYQMNSKRAEAMTNLTALATSQKSYHGEFGTFVTVLGEPITTSGVAPGSDKRSSGAITTAYSVLGWTTEGGVYYDYDSCSAGGAGCTCACTVCFTVSAWGDLDDDGNMSAYMYFEPDQAGNTCQSQVDGHFPPVYQDGGEILHSASWHGATDDF